MMVGTVHLASGLPYGLTLIVFYLSSSKLTRWRAELKERLEDGHMAGGQRNAAQVLANSGLGCCLALVAAAPALLPGSGVAAGPWRAAAQLGFVGFYACCCGDTWSSEVGIASQRLPRLITSWRTVPPGTNGGISLLGTLAAGMGGASVGVCFCAASAVAEWWSASHAADHCGITSASEAAACHACLAALASWRVVALATAAGSCGSLTDSLLGATLQYSGWDTRTGRMVSHPPKDAAAAAAVKHISGRNVLSNTWVNVAASALTSAATAAAGVRLLGC